MAHDVSLKSERNCSLVFFDTVQSAPRLVRLTFPLQDELGGLEVENRDGDWLAARPIPGTLVVNFAAMVPVLTNGLDRANMHRVLNGSARRVRHSAPVFDPDHDFQVACVPTCRPESGEPDDPPMTAQDHMRTMFGKSFGQAA